MVGNEINGPSVTTNVEICNKIQQDINDVDFLELPDINCHLELSYGEPSVEHVKFKDLQDKDSIFSDESDEKLPSIPDGGWGWVVVFAGFLISACAEGLAYSFGVLHEEFTNYFEESQSKTSLIGSLFIATPLISGPIMSALVDKYGCRTMTIIAGIMSTVGFVLASQSNSVEVLCVTLGIMSGLSLGILYVTAVVSVAFWFDKRRTFAVSIASCGIGFGTLVYSLLTNFLIELYDWRNTLILLAGTILNMCVCGALMRDPDWLIIKTTRERKLAKARSIKSSSAVSISSKSIGGESVYLTAEELNDLLKSGKSPEYILATLSTSLAVAEQLEATTRMNTDQSFKRINSDIHIPTFIRQNEKVPAEVIEKLMTNKSLFNILIQNYPHVINRRKSDINLLTHIKEPLSLNVTVFAEKPKGFIDKTKEENDIHKEMKETLTNAKDKAKNTKQDEIMNPKNEVKRSQQAKKMKQMGWVSRHSTDPYYHHYFKNTSLYRNSIMHRGAVMNINKYKLRTSSLPDIYRHSTWSLYSEEDAERKWYIRIFNAFMSYFDMRMLTEFHFLMLNLASVILCIWAIIPYFFLKSYMTTRDVEGGALMISIIGVSSAVGIVALGWAGDQPWMNVTKAFAVCLFICGLSVAAYPLFITNYWALTVISTIFGLSYASSYSYTPAILIELMPIDYFTIGYGFILLSQGLGHLIGPPLGGLLFDLTKSWDLTFYVGGLWLVIAGVCVGVIPYTKNFRICGSGPLLQDEEAEDKSSINV